MLHPFASVDSLDSDISDIFAPMSLQAQPPGATKFEDSIKVVSSNEPTTTATLPDCSKLTASDFDTLALLGRGDVGKVYLVHLKGAPENEHVYAMKVLDNADLKKRDKLSRLDTEKKILQTVHHPNIVALYGIFQDEASTYLLMEYCSCGEFFKFLQSQPSKCLPEVAVKFYAAEVLNALEYLHKIGVVYRDLKPENILLHRSGHVRLTDFDLSKMCQENLENRKYRSSIKHVLRIDNEEHRQLHQFNSFVGTPEYFAPEIITGYGYSSLVDYWALGILIFEMLFGYTPFRGENNNTTFDQILHGTYSVPESNCHGPISKSCRELIKKLVCADVHHRLGHKHGAIDIKNHAFFSDIDFNNLANSPPPIQPHLHTKEVGQSVSIQDSQDSSGSGEIEKLYSVEDNFDHLDHLAQ